jgi:hypothetical protein
MCKTTTKRTNVALPPTPGTPPSGSPVNAATLSQIQPNQAPDATAKVLKMPLPTQDDVTKDVRAVTFPRFNSSGRPALEDVQQSHHISNCPVASILAAHAFTAVGKTLIEGLVPAPTSANVVTDLSDLPPDTLTNPPPDNKVTSSRFFTVTLPGGTREVSDVVYTDDADSGFSLLYMSDPSDRSIWAAMIEKALAVEIGSYENFDALPLSANDWWEKLTGVAPTGFSVTATTPLSQITAAAQASTTVPTIGASKDTLPIGDDITGFHGFAMIGMQGSNVHLYDPAKTIKILISPKDFRDKFQAVLVTP